MTAAAAILWPRSSIHMLRMIKLHIETFFERHGKILKRWFISTRIRVTDEAHWHTRRYEL